MTFRTANVLLLAAALQLVPYQLPAQSISSTDEVTTTADPVERAAEAEQRIPFDPALVGLPGFPYSLTTSEDYARARKLIEARLAELVGPGTDGEPAENGERSRAVPADDAAEAQVQAQDPRAAALEALLLAVEKGAILAARDRDLDESLAEQEAELDKVETQDLGIDPPYPTALLDQLRTQHALTEYSDQMVDQRRAQAQRQAELSAEGLAAAMSERRGIRDRLTTAEDADARRSLEGELEVARLNTLVALRQHDNALAQQNLAREEDALTAAQLALLERKIAVVQDDVVFSAEALESRLTEVQSREDALLARFKELAGSNEEAESRLFQARRRLQEETSENERKALQERVTALEQELQTARRGVEYRGQLNAIAETARTMIQRRFSVLQGTEQNSWPAWLRETQQLIRELDKDRDFSLAELSALHSKELALSRRVAAPDLDPNIREAVEQQIAGIENQSRLAEEMLLIQDQVRTLAQRLRLDLDPRVQERSIDQRLDGVREQLAQWWDTEIAVVQDHGIYVRDAVTALGVFLLVYVIVWLLQLVLGRRVLPKLATKAKQQEEERRSLRAVLAPLIRNTNQLFVLVVAFYAAMSVSGLGQGKLQDWLWTLLILAFYFQIGIWANAGVVEFFKRKRSRKEREDPSAVTGYGLLLFFIRVGIWMMVGVSVLTYFKYPVAGLIGALGVGGIAVAFAVQNILSDVFSSMAIILDKPFRVGDFIIAGETIGVIEHIGVKTTRIKSLSGEQVVMSNTDLLGSCIHNYKHMRERRVVFKIGVVYETPADKLERIPGIIAEIIRAQPRARFDRAHFFEYSDFSLVFEIVYYVYGADYVVYMDTQQAINLGIYRRFQEEGISFAYPTQKLIVRRPAEALSPTPEPTF